LKLLGAETPTSNLLVVWEFFFGLGSLVAWAKCSHQRYVLKLSKAPHIDSDSEVSIMDWSSLGCIQTSSGLVYSRKNQADAHQNYSAKQTNSYKVGMLKGFAFASRHHCCSGPPY